MKTIAAFLLVLCHLAISHAWNCNKFSGLSDVQQIDAGQGQVAATDKHNHAYLLSGSSWYRLPSDNIKHVTVGHAGIWAVDTSNYIYKLVAGKWSRVNGLLKQIDAGGNLFIAGANHINNAYCLKTSDTLGFKGVGIVSWTQMPTSLMYYSCGPYGCWGVDTSDRIYLTQSVTPSSCSNSGWTQISGALKMVEVGSDGSVFGVNASGKVYQRIGITSCVPQGTTWTQLPMSMTMKHVSYDLGKLWVVSTSGQVFQCTE
ncbi:fish-egg lectin-like [Centroberyx gerrardi]|uniref:fish-egg lectin-like n=1 Tax=Centroberyx gerrardi TaxID=166262 RepID=UPI003AAC5F1D